MLTHYAESAAVRPVVSVAESKQVAPLQGYLSGILPETVAEIASKVAELGLPGDPHPDRLSACGIRYSPDGRAKKAEGKRRRERARLLEELRTLPADQPLPIELTDRAKTVLSRKANRLA